jgi:hypothetical protein
MGAHDRALAAHGADSGLTPPGAQAAPGQQPGAPQPAQQGVQPAAPGAGAGAPSDQDLMQLMNPGGAGAPEAPAPNGAPQGG